VPSDRREQKRRVELKGTDAKHRARVAGMSAKTKWRKGISGWKDLRDEGRGIRGVR
jgi:hypothetical protein